MGDALNRALSGRRSPVRIADDLVMARLSEQADLKAALFRLVDVAPACRSWRDVSAHLAALLAEPAADGHAPSRLIHRAASAPAGRPVVGLAAGAATRRMGRRFIVGRSAADARGTLRRLWGSGVATSVDLLGEATVTQEEAERYAERCHRSLSELDAVYRGLPERPVLERDSAGPLPRVNLSVKVSALTPVLRSAAPERGADDAAPRLRDLLRHARDLGAHLHVDMESFDGRDAVQGLVGRLLAEPEFATGPSVGMVLQGYLRESGADLERLLADVAAIDREPPLTIRLVKGAYWDHEVVEAGQHGWSSPVFEHKAETDANFERLTTRLLEARPQIRVAIASHNLRSVSHAIARSRALGGDDADLELQILRGLGDDLQDAIAAQGLRVRAYCPVGDIVAGMAYLVRRLLENTANDSFLEAQRRHTSLDELLAPPAVAAVAA